MIKITNQGFTFIELLCVIVILSVLTLVSYPKLNNYLHRQKLSNIAFELVSELNKAKNYSVNRVDNLKYGVLIEKDGTYSQIALHNVTKFDLKESIRQNIKIIGTKNKIDPSISILNFHKYTNLNEIIIIFRYDGIPTSDGFTFPISDMYSQIELQSNNTSDKILIKINKINGNCSLE